MQWLKKYRIAYLDDAIPAGQTALALLEEDFVNKDSVNQADNNISNHDTKHQAKSSHRQKSRLGGDLS